MSLSTPRLRHVVLVVDDLEQSASLMCRVLGLQEAFREPSGQLGLDMENVVMAVGDQFLEVCAGSHPNAPAQRYLERAGGPGGYMVLLQFADFDAARKRVFDNGARAIWEFEDGEQRECQLHPKDVGGAIVGIEWSREWANWRWAGPDWRKLATAAPVAKMSGITISTRAPGELADRWNTLFGIAFTPTQPDELVARLFGDRIVLRSADREPRVTAVHLIVDDVQAIQRRAAAAGLPVTGDSIQLLGVNFELSRSDDVGAPPADQQFPVS